MSRVVATVGKRANCSRRITGNMPFGGELAGKRANGQKLASGQAREPASARAGKWSSMQVGKLLITSNMPFGGKLAGKRVTGSREVGQTGKLANS
jgi:hypothetical protein